MSKALFLRPNQKSIDRLRPANIFNERDDFLDDQLFMNIVYKEHRRNKHKEPKPQLTKDLLMRIRNTALKKGIKFDDVLSKEDFKELIKESRKQKAKQKLLDVRSRTREQQDILHQDDPMSRFSARRERMLRAPLGGGGSVPPVVSSALSRVSGRSGSAPAGMSSPGPSSPSVSSFLDSIRRGLGL